MKVSVIIPFKNEMVYVKDCLDSLRDQEMTDFEAILVCDHFEGDIEEVIGDYRGTLELKVFHLKDKTGVAAARNVGLEQAVGTYVFFLDSDDYILVDTLKNLLQVAEHCETQFVYGVNRETWFKRSVFLENEKIVDVEEKDPIEIDSEEQEEPNEAKTLVSDINLETDTTEVILAKKRNLACRSLLTKKKGLQHISVLNILFLRSWLEENELLFHDQLKYYSDFPFVMETLEKAENIDCVDTALYIKRKHNDPINQPSLLQVKDDLNFNDCMQAYAYAITKIDELSDVRIRLDKKMIHYYAITIAPLIRKSKKKKWREESFQAMKAVVEGMREEVIHSVSPYKRKLVKVLKQGNLEKTNRLIGRHTGFQMVVMLIKNKSERKKFIYKKIFAKQPLLEKVVLFESFFGKSYSDSPKYIYEYMSEQYPEKYKYVWIVDKKKKDLPFKTTQIKRLSLSYYYYLARAKYIVFNSRQPKYFIKRKGSIFLETWHGTPLKKLVFDMEEVTTASPLYKEQFYIQSRSWDYLIAANHFSEGIFKRAFMYDKTMLAYGYPRNDILHWPNKTEIAEKIKRKLGIPKEKKTILYAPTWRDDDYYGVGKYKFELKLNLALLKKQLGDEYVLILRTHYFIQDHLDTTGMEGFVFNLSLYDDIAELYLISDILITDYSSVFFDFANLKRPMLFFTYDLEKYRDVLRGFYIDMQEELPGPLLFTTEEVVEAIRNIDTLSDKYREKYEVFYEKFCGLEDGHASENVVREVFKN